LRTRLLDVGTPGTLRSVIVTSPHAGEGKTQVAANLAVALAQSGRRVALISADLRRPRLHALFGIPQEPGLSSILVSEPPLPWRAVVASPLDNLLVLSSGPVPPNPAELLSSQEMVDALEQIQREVEIVVIDAPPVLGIADTAALAGSVNGVVLVADAASTTRAALATSAHELRDVHAEIVGTVLNNFDEAKSRLYEADSAYEGDVSRVRSIDRTA
jgi:capsular exopolysaccharide synthesis family protein